MSRCPVQPASGRNPLRRSGLSVDHSLCDWCPPPASRPCGFSLSADLRSKAIVLRGSPSCRIVPASALPAAGHASPLHVFFIGRCSATCAASHPWPGREFSPGNRSWGFALRSFFLFATCGMFRSVSICIHPDIPTCRLVKSATSINFHRGIGKPIVADHWRLLGFPAASKSYFGRWRIGSGSPPNQAATALGFSSCRVSDPAHPRVARRTSSCERMSECRRTLESRIGRRPPEAIALELPFRSWPFSTTAG